MFTGLSAFPITPFTNEEIDYKAFERLIDNLVAARVDSICAMGSTGLYPYLSKAQLEQVAKMAVASAKGTPVMAGIGSLRTRDVLENLEAVQHGGVDAVLRDLSRTGFGRAARKRFQFDPKSRDRHARHP